MDVIIKMHFRFYMPNLGVLVRFSQLQLWNSMTAEEMERLSDGTVSRSGHFVEAP